MHRSRVLIVIASSAAALVTGLTVPASAAPTATNVSLSSSLSSITSSSGQSLHISLYAMKVTTSGATNLVQSNLTLQNRTGVVPGEKHTWSYSLSRADFAYNSSTGRGSLNTGSELGPLGKVSVNFHRTSQSTTKCSVSGSLTTVKGTLAGMVHFVTGTGWHTVGSTSRTFTFATPNYLYVSNGCNSGEGTAQCYAYTTWSGPSSGAFFAGGSRSTYNGKTTSEIFGDRSVPLTSPHNSTRFDSLIVLEPAPTISGTTMTITTKSGTPISGSGKLTGGTANTTTSPCKSGTSTRTETTKLHYGATWSSPSRHHLRFNFQATADLTVSGSGSGTWSVSTHN